MLHEVNAYIMEPVREKKDFAGAPKKIEDLRKFDEFLRSEESGNIDNFYSPEYWENNYKRLVSSISEILSFFTEKDNPWCEHFEHDAKTVLTKIKGYLREIIEKVPNSEDFNISFDLLKKSWPRISIVLEDVLLRSISEKEIDNNFQKGVDLDTVTAVLGYFKDIEFSTLLDEDLVNSGTFIADDKKSPEIAELVRQHNENQARVYGENENGRYPYKGISEKRMSFPSSQDFERLKINIAGRKIKGNTALVSNFVLNALRNSLKCAIEAKNIHLKIFVENNNLVIKIEDNGKGMLDENLDPSSPKFIFKKGSSSTGSSGHGLTHFNERLKSVGGGLEIFSKRKDDPKNEMEVNPFVYYNNFGQEDLAYSFISGQNARKFVRGSNIQGHGTEIKIYLPLVA